MNPHNQTRRCGCGGGGVTQEEIDEAIRKANEERGEPVLVPIRAPDWPVRKEEEVEADR